MRQSSPGEGRFYSRHGAEYTDRLPGMAEAFAELPTRTAILVTNDRRSSACQLITRYAKRMLIENALADAVRFFPIDALSSSVGLKVDFDMALLVLASGLYRLMANRMRGYQDAQARQIFRDLIDMRADISISQRKVMVRFHREPIGSLLALPCRTD